MPTAVRTVDDLIELAVAKLQVDGRKATLAQSLRKLAETPEQLRAIAADPEKLNRKLADAGLQITPEGVQELKTLVQFIDTANIADVKARIGSLDRFIAVTSDSSSTTSSMTASATSSGI